MARRALVVGINKYDVFHDLSTCVADAVTMQQLLERNADGSPNYSCRLLVHDKGRKTKKVTIPLLRDAFVELFNYSGDVLLFFSGHGAMTSTGGYIATSDAEPDNWGIPMQEILDLASRSPARDVLIILDCCHAGAVGNVPLFSIGNGNSPLAVLRENMTIIAASRASESAMESEKYSLFTASVLEALDGGAADHMGWVTAQSIYAYVERGFGSWVQRPVYKSHASDLTVVRQCAPLIERLKLHQLTALFPTVDHRFRLDPKYEPEDENGNLHKPVDKKKVERAKLFKDFRDVGLVKSSNGEQFYWVARHSGTLELTLRGREYWQLVKGRRI